MRTARGAPTRTRLGGALQRDPGDARARPAAGRATLLRGPLGCRGRQKKDPLPLRWLRRCTRRADLALSLRVALCAGAMEHFEKLSSLGRGAQGSVILVRRRADDSRFVIKRIFVDDNCESDMAETRNEIRVLAALAHPAIVGYHGSFVEEGVLNVVMEHADGGSLFQHIQRAREPFSEERVLSWFAELVMAMRHMHDKKILHRDLKSKNVFLTAQGDIKYVARCGPRVFPSNEAFGFSLQLSPC